MFLKIAKLSYYCKIGGNYDLCPQRLVGDQRLYLQRRRQAGPSQVRLNHFSICGPELIMFGLSAVKARIAFDVLF